jgi:hypothetical protein
MTGSALIPRAWHGTAAQDRQPTRAADRSTESHGMLRLFVVVGRGG